MPRGMRVAGMSRRAPMSRGVQADATRGHFCRIADRRQRMHVELALARVRGTGRVLECHVSVRIEAAIDRRGVRARRREKQHTCHENQDDRTGEVRNPAPARDDVLHVDIPCAIRLQTGSKGRVRPSAHADRMCRNLPITTGRRLPRTIGQLQYRRIQGLVRAGLRRAYRGMLRQRQTLQHMQCFGQRVVLDREVTCIDITARGLAAGKVIGQVAFVLVVE